MFKRAILSLLLLLAATPAFAQVKISGLPSATTPLVGSELTVIVQGGVTKQSTATAVANSLTTLTGSITGTYTLAGTPTLGAALTATGQTITGGTFSGITLSGTTALPNSGAISSSGLIGLGMNPTNIIDITQSQNAASQITILNNNGGASAAAGFVGTNGTNSFTLLQLGTAFTTSGVKIAGDVALSSIGAVDIVAGSTIKFAVNGSTTEVARFATDGTQLWNSTTTVGPGTAFTGAYLQGSSGQLVLAHTGTSSQTLQGFYNGNGLVGSVSTNASATAFNTSSDRRLKIDRGIATDITQLKSTVVHDFAWKSDGSKDRGIFAQDEADRGPLNAVSRGDTGAEITKVWQVDYSKYVPDLIVGWQNHESRLERLENSTWHRIGAFIGVD